MNPDPIQLLEAAEHLAVLMVDQIEYVDLYEEAASKLKQQHVREDGRFCQEASTWIRLPRQRDLLKRLVEKMAGRIRLSPTAQRMLSPEDLEAACELVASAVKALLVTNNRANEWLKRRRLVIKFDSIESPWIQDKAPGAVATANWMLAPN